MTWNSCYTKCINYWDLGFSPQRYLLPEENVQVIRFLVPFAGNVWLVCLPANTWDGAASTPHILGALKYSHYHAGNSRCSPYLQLCPVADKRWAERSTIIYTFPEVEGHLLLWPISFLFTCLFFLFLSKCILGKWVKECYSGASRYTLLLFNSLEIILQITSLDYLNSWYFKATSFKLGISTEP